MLKIIDLSQNNGSVDFAKLKGQIDGVILRVGYRGYGWAGTMVTDTMFREYASQCNKLGIPLGVYWVTQATSDVEAISEAAYVEAHIRSYDLALPVFLDSEWGEYQTGTGRADRLPKKIRTQYALTFLCKMRDYGYRTGLYTGTSWFQTEIDGEAIRADGNAIWLASVENIEPAIPYDAWQYSWKGQLDGINTDVDMNQFRPSLMRSMGKYYMDTAGHWAESAIDKVTDAGLMTGKGNDRFDPDATMTRAEVATVLSRLLDKQDN